MSNFFKKMILCSVIVSSVLLSFATTSPRSVEAATTTSVGTQVNKEALLQILLVLQSQLVELQLAYTKAVAAEKALVKEFASLLSPLRSGAEIEYINNGYGYRNVCTMSMTKKVQGVIEGKGGKFLCASSDDKYTIAASINSKNTRAHCIDSTGESKEITAAEYNGVKAALACHRDEQKNKPVSVSEEDYIRGSALASINIVTFTDLECPFCKLFHSTLNSIVKSNKDVSIAYRHFPIEQLHPNAKEIAVAAECVGSIAGDDAFWNFTDSLFTSREVNEPTNMSKLAYYASKEGVSSLDFSSCRQSDIAKIAVEDDMAEGLYSGVQGTPHSYVFKDGVMVYPISGAQPLSTVERIIENLQ
jgi:protein-disulfide isomerase